MHTYHAQLASYSSLYAAWDRVAANDGAPGVDGVSVNKFDVNFERHLERLHTELTTFTYHTLPLRRYEIPKPNGKVRFLAVPAVRDRVVQSSAMIVLQPVVERELETCSFAYRPGLSRLTAIEHIRQLRDEGYRWVLDADIESFFDNVEFGLLLRRFRQLVPENPTVALVEQWIKAPVLVQGTLVKRTKGIPQGSPISPVLANLFLDRFDEELLKRKHRLVRYADDFVILCKTRPRAEEALKLTEDVLASFELHLNKEKTSITTFDQGFKYLGAIFLKGMIIPSKKTKLRKGGKAMTRQRRQSAKNDPKDRTPTVPDAKTAAGPPPDETKPTEFGTELLDALSAKNMTIADLVSGQQENEPRPLPADISPFMRTLYIQEQGCWLKYSHDKFIVSTGGEEGVALQEIPTMKVSQIMVFGSCLITPAAMRYALLHFISITLLSSRGQYFGRIENTEGADVTLERLQFRRSADAAFVLATARNFVEGKLENTRLFLQRHRQKQREQEVSNAIEQLKRVSAGLVRADTLDAVRGYEGRASAIFFSVYDDLFTAEGFTFEKRIRRPPTDPVNAMLSFGYTLLFYNIYSLARVHRLNPYVGSLHADKTNHPALVSDLIEEFRFLIEGMVLGIINKRLLAPADFSRASAEDKSAADDARPTACMLSDEARRVFIGEFERLMHRTVTHPPTGYTVTYRRCLDLQVQNYVQHLRDEKPYIPFSRR
ncbi:MAG: group II intron reverse transcriptase/maturase [Bacteroidetes bacterium]|nr:group II intron reverse transcriptase/maturase [Bacteroidota bacterium]MCW5897532.1 group II intron reverse transcriptase/maturase [Bacteroidota bacterium]